MIKDADRVGGLRGSQPSFPEATTVGSAALTTTPLLSRRRSAPTPRHRPVRKRQAFHHRALADRG